MRISDWSSDVCSSDLVTCYHRQGCADMPGGGILGCAPGQWEESSCLLPRSPKSSPHRPSVSRTPCAMESNARRKQSTGFKLSGRSVERSVGKECVSTGSSWWQLYHSKNKNYTQ